MLKTYTNCQGKGPTEARVEAEILRRPTSMWRLSACPCPMTYLESPIFSSQNFSVPACRRGFPSKHQLKSVNTGLSAAKRYLCLKDVLSNKVYLNFSQCGQSVRRPCSRSSQRCIGNDWRLCATSFLRSLHLLPSSEMVLVALRHASSALYATTVSTYA